MFAKIQLLCENISIIFFINRHYFINCHYYFFLLLFYILY